MIMLFLSRLPCNSFGILQDFRTFSRQSLLHTSANSQQQRTFSLFLRHDEFSGEVKRSFLFLSNNQNCISKAKLNTKNDKVVTSIRETKDHDGKQLTLGEKVKQTGKDVTYTGIIVVGLGVTGLMFYTIFRELFSKQSPSGIYGEALKLCRKNVEVIASVGEPIKGYGELSSRGRRRHVSHMEYVQDGVNMMRMKFYLEGSLKKGTVNLEMKENDQGKYEYRYLFVELDGFPPKVIVLEDHR